MIGAGILFVGFGYRYGFNGKEKDTQGEWGNQTHYDYGFRIYNPAIGKFLSVDPLTKEYPYYTPYQFAGNKPIQAIDLDGLEEWDVTGVGGNEGTVNGPYSNQEGAQSAADNGAATISYELNEISVTATATRSENSEFSTWTAEGNTYTQVTSNTLIVRDDNFATEDAGYYAFIAPQNYGSWNEVGSDGLYHIGCLSCHATNGAYNYAAYNSQEQLQGQLIAYLLENAMLGSLLSTEMKVVKVKSKPFNHLSDFNKSYSYWDIPRASGGGVLTPTKGYAKGQFMPGRVKMLNYGRGTDYNYLRVNGSPWRPTGTNYTAFSPRNMRRIGIGGGTAALLRAYINNLNKVKGAK